MESKTAITGFHGPLFVYPDENGDEHICVMPPFGFQGDLTKVRSFTWSGPRILSPEKVENLAAWFTERQLEGFVFVPLKLA